MLMLSSIVSAGFVGPNFNRVLVKTAVEEATNNQEVVEDVILKPVTVKVSFDTEPKVEDTQQQDEPVKQTELVEEKQTIEPVLVEEETEEETGPVMRAMYFDAAASTNTITQDHSVVLVGLKNGQVNVYDTNNMNLLWTSFDHTAEIFDSQFDGTNVYLSSNGRITRHNSNTGALEKTYLFASGRNIFSFDVDDSFIYAGDSRGYLHKISKSTGSVAKTIDVYSSSNPQDVYWDNIERVRIGTDNKVYVSGGYGKVDKYTKDLVFDSQIYNEYGSHIFAMEIDGTSAYFVDSSSAIKVDPKVDKYTMFNQGDLVVRPGTTSVSPSSVSYGYDIDVDDLHSGKVYIAQRDGKVGIFHMTTQPKSYTSIGVSLSSTEDSVTIEGTVDINDNKIFVGGKDNKMTWFSKSSESELGSFNYNYEVTEVNSEYTTKVANEPPQLDVQLPDKTINEDSSNNYLFDANGFFSDFDGDTITYTASGYDSTLVTISINADGNVYASTATANKLGNTQVTITASDGSKTISDTFTLTVNAVNDAPVLSNGDIPDQSIDKGSINNNLFDLDDFFSEPDNQALSFTSTISGTNLISVTITGNNEVIVSTLNPNGVGSTFVTITASDGSLSKSDTFMVTVIGTNGGLSDVVVLPDKSINEDTTNNYLFDADSYFTDDDTTQLTYTVVVSNTKATVTVGTDGVVRASAATQDATGTVDVIITASDGSNSQSASFTLTINPVNDAPVVSLALPDEYINEDSTGNILFSGDNLNNYFSDVDGDTLSYYVSVGNSGLVSVSINAAKQLVANTVAANAAGSSTVTVTASDGSKTISDTFTLTVNPVNDGPVLSTSIPDKTINEDSMDNMLFDLDNHFRDDDGDDLGYGSGLTFPTYLTMRDVPHSEVMSDVSVVPYGDGTVLYTATVAQPRYFAAQPIYAIGGNTWMDTSSLIVTRDPLQGGPGDYPSYLDDFGPANVVIVPVTDWIGDGIIRPVTPITPVDPGEGGATVRSYTATGYDTTLVSISIDSNGVVYASAVTENKIGWTDITITATDGNGGSASDTFRLTVTSTNDAPVLSAIGDLTGFVGTQFTHDVDATDVDSTDLTYYSNTSLFTINPITGVISFTPVQAQIGSHGVQISVSDGTAIDSEDITFTIGDNSIPDVTITSPTEGDYFNTPSVTMTYTSTATDISHYNVRNNAGSWLGNSKNLQHAFILSEGTHNLEVQAVDGSSNSATDNVNITVDLTAPNVAITSPSNNAVLAGAQQWITWTGSDNFGIDYYSIIISGDASLSETRAVGSPSYLGTFADGNYTATVIAYDNAGNSATDNVNFTVDNTNPNVTITYPTNNAFVNTGSFNVNWESTSTDISYYLADGVHVGTSTSQAVNLVDGVYSYTVTAYDTTGLTGSDNVNFTVDTIAPTISITAPVDDAVLTNGLVTLNWTASDAQGIEKFMIQDSTTPPSTFVANVTNTTFSYDLSLSDGNYHYSITAIDFAGHMFRDSVNFTIDTNTPDVTITSPINDAFVNTSSFNVNWTSTATDIAYYTVNGTNVGLNTDQAVNLVDGVYSYTVTAYDAGGLFASDNVNFTVDTTAPLITVTNPVDSALLTNGSVNLNWTGSDTYGIAYYLVNDESSFVGIASNVSSTTNNFTLTLGDGDYSYRVTAVDNAGNTASDTVNFTVDSGTPDVTITSPINDAIVNTSSFNITWTSSATDISYYTANGTNVGTNTQQAVNLVDGVYTYTVVAYDAAGLTGSDNVNFTVDTTAPTVSFTAPTDNALLSTRPVTFNWTGSDANGIDHYELNGTDMGTNTSFSIFSLPAYNYTFVITAYDNAGNKANDTVSFELSTDVPDITITSPINDAFVNTNLFNITWTSNATDIAYFLANGTNVSTNTSQAVTLVDGVYSYTVLVNDTTGLTSSDTVNFTVDTTAPNVTITTPANNAIRSTGNLTINWIGTDTYGIVYYTVNGTNVGLNTSYNVSLVDGDYNYVVTAFDNAGNSATDNVNFTIDTTLPTLAITYPTNNALLNTSNITVTWNGTGATYYAANGTNVGLNTSANLTGLTEGNHTYIVTAFDSAAPANQISDSVYFTIDTIAPVITNVSVTTTNSSATITWDTVESSNSYIDYGTTTAYGLNHSNASYVNVHALTVGPLPANTTYYFMLSSTDRAGNTGTYVSSNATDSNFTTDPADNDVPTAVAQMDSPCYAGGPCDYNASASYDTNGTITDYAWNFSGTGLSNNSIGTHVFTNAGNYNVTLTITDNGTLTDDDTITVQVLNNTGINPVADAGIDQMIPVNSIVTFDGTGSTDNIGIYNYSWNIVGGANIGTGATPTYNFTTPGLYTIRLTVMDREGLTDTDDMTVAVYNNSATQPDIAVNNNGFTINPIQSGTINATVKVYNLGNATTNNFTVRFNHTAVNFTDVVVNGLTNATMQPVSVMYTLPSGTVSFTAIADNANNITESDETNNKATLSFTNLNAAPNARFSAKAPSGFYTKAGINFNAGSTTDSDGTIVSYAWNFGDSTTGTGVTTTHSYTNAGNYTVTLTVTDDDGATDVTTRVLNIQKRGTGTGPTNPPGGGSGDDTSSSPDTSGNESIELQAVFIDDLVTYEVGDFIITRDYFYNPNTNRGWYTMEIENVGDKDYVIRLEDTNAFSVAVDPIFDYTVGNKFGWEINLTSEDTYGVVYNFDNEVTPEEVKGIGVPSIEDITPSEPETVPGPVTTPTPEPEEPSAFTGLLTFLNPEFWGAWTTLLILLAAIVLIAVGWVMLKDQGYAISLSGSTESPFEEVDFNQPSNYAEGTLY